MCYLNVKLREMGRCVVVSIGAREEGRKGRLLFNGYSFRFVSWKNLEICSTPMSI